MNMTPYQLDALTELINIGVGRAAGMLNQILEAHVHLQVPTIKVFLYAELESILKDEATIPLSIVQLKFKGTFSGTALLAFPAESASHLVDILTGEEADMGDLDSIRVGALAEVGNIILNGVMGSISNVLQQHLLFSVPIYLEDTIHHLLQVEPLEPATTIILANTEILVEKFQIHGNVILLFRVDLFHRLLESFETM